MSGAVKALESLKKSGAFSGKQLTAINEAIGAANGEVYKEGAVYKRIAPPGAKTCDDLYVASSKLAPKAGDTRKFNLLNVTHRSGKPTREIWSAGRFSKVADSMKALV